MHASFSLLGDMCPTRQLGVPRAPRSGPQSYRDVVMRRLDLGLASLSSFRLSWEELGPAMRALIGGVALFAPLDSELEFDWFHGFDQNGGALPTSAEARDQRTGAPIPPGTLRRICTAQCTPRLCHHSVVPRAPGRPQ